MSMYRMFFHPFARPSANAATLRAPALSSIVLAAGSIRGTIPPLGHAIGIPILCDVQVHASNFIIGGGGGKGFDLVMPTATFLEYSQAVATALSAVNFSGGGSRRRSDNRSDATVNSKDQGKHPKRKKWQAPAVVIDGASVRRASRKGDDESPRHALQVIGHPSLPPTTFRNTPHCLRTTPLSLASPLHRPLASLPKSHP
jgi:hypothetical protein